MSEASTGKDSTTGHRELAGCVVEESLDTFESLPQDLLDEIGGPFIGKKAPTATAVLSEQGEEQVGAFQFGVSRFRSQSLSGLEGFLKLVGEFIESHGFLGLMQLRTEARRDATLRF